MGISVGWDSDVQTTLLFAVSSSWTWEEFYASIELARQLADSSELQYIHSIVDIHEGSMFPQNALLHFRRMPFNASPKLKAGTIVIVGGSFFVKALMDILRHLNYDVMERFHSVHSLQEAHALLAKEQATAESIPSSM